ncbi:hypothetical protein RRG08_054786 [Elysia crispata]|uniref:Uncharacterized protein n=1 Tax=Elysia crispata TaxID=231223 RepID=A0AAE1ADG9_9GAST|nr:hypothetical protein RRG08_054786 [Elysia crispata]
MSIEFRKELEPSLSKPANTLGAPSVIDRSIRVVSLDRIFYSVASSGKLTFRLWVTQILPSDLDLDHVSFWP